MLQRALADGGVVWRAMSHKVAVVSDRKPLCRPRQIVQVFHGADTACCVKYSYATKNYESPFLSSLGATLEYLTKAKPSAGPAYGPWLRSGKNALWAAGAAALSSRCGSATESRLFWSLSGPLVSNWHHLSPTRLATTVLLTSTSSLVEPQTLRNDSMHSLPR